MSIIRLIHIKIVPSEPRPRPLASRAQQPATPVVALVGGDGGDVSTRYVLVSHKREECDEEPRHCLGPLHTR